MPGQLGEKLKNVQKMIRKLWKITILGLNQEQQTRTFIYVNAWDELLFKVATCCVYPVMVVDATNMQIRTSTQVLMMYSAKQIKND